VTDHAAALATAREDIERSIMEARLHDDPTGAVLHGLASALAALEPLALALTQPRLLGPEAERELIRETSKAIARETWRQLAIHARDIRFVAWLAGVLGAAAFVRRRLYAGHEVVKRLTLPERDTARRYGGDARARRGATPWPFLSYDRKSGLGRILAAIWARESGALSFKKGFTAQLAAALLSMARQGEGVAWIPQSLAAEDIEAGRLVDPGFGRFSVDVEILLFRPVHSQTRTAEAFWNAISAERPDHGHGQRPRHDEQRHSQCRAQPAQRLQKQRAGQPERQDRRQRAQHVEQRVHADLDELRGEQDCAVIGEADEPFQGIKSGLLERNPDHERGRVERDGQQEQNHRREPEKRALALAVSASSRMPSRTVD